MKVCRLLVGTSGIIFAPSFLLRSHHALVFHTVLGGTTAITSSHTPRYRLPARGQPCLMTPLPSR